MSDKKQMDIKRLNEILTSTIDSIKSSKDEIVEICEYSKNEHQRLEKELETLKHQVQEQILEVIRLEKLNKEHRISLSKKSKEFHNYSEHEIQEAYDLANQTRIMLLLKREEEKNLASRRNHLEISLKNSYTVYKKAESLNKQITVATEYLLGNMGDITSTVDELNQNSILGIKIIEAQEEERLRVARDIHDGPAQSLANIILKAELCEKLMEVDPQRTKDELKDLKEITKNTLREVRKVIYELRPMSLDDLGLVPTLEKYIDNFQEETKIYVEFRLIGSMDKTSSIIEVAIFRIIQESLNNIRKHSKASNAKIIMEKLVNKLNISIVDDGVGFESGSYSNSYENIVGKFGLISIKQRVDLLDGEFKITSSENTGTKLSIYIPLREED